MICTAEGCAGELTIGVRDATGQPVGTLTATVTLPDRTYVVTCTQLGSDQFEGSVLDSWGGRSLFEPCGRGWFALPGPFIPDQVATVRAESTQGRFEGTVMPDYTTIEDFNGAGCGDCTSGSGSITLE